MKLDEIRKSEDRTEDDLMTIHFYLENDWWRAYEWSAYLCSIFPNNIEEKNKLKITHKENDLVFGGMKLASFDKYLPKATPSQVNDKHIVIDVSEFIKNEDLSYEKYKEILSEWKKTIPMKKDEKVKNASEIKLSEIGIQNSGITYIIKEVISYPLESKNLIDNVYFIMHLKEELNKLL